MWPIFLGVGRIRCFYSVKQRVGVDIVRLDLVLEPVGLFDEIHGRTDSIVAQISEAPVPHRFIDDENRDFADLLQHHRAIARRRR